MAFPVAASRPKIRGRGGPPVSITHRYRFDNASDIGEDTVGSLDLTNFNSVTQGAAHPSFSGNSAEGDGGTQKLVGTDHTDYEWAGNLGGIFFSWYHDVTALQTVASKRAGTAAGNWGITSQSGTLTFTVVDSGVASNALAIGSGLSTGTWYQGRAWFASGTIYGSYDASATQSLALTNSIATSTRKFHLLGYDGGGLEWDGRVDDVILFSNPNEVANPRHWDNYKAGLL